MSAGNVDQNPAWSKKTIEETYQKKTQLEHILLRPDTYVGSIDKHTQNLWVYENDKMVHRSVSYVPGLYKIFDEILVNAADNKQRDSSMNSLKVVIDVEQNCISVFNNGDGIPVEVHQEEKVYVPELIFGYLLTSSNYDDTEKKTTGGRNGYGAKLTNIFSTEFVIETADGKRLKKYKQVFSNNMGKKSVPKITKCKQGENWTKVTFKPDLAKFNMTHLEDDVVALMKKRVLDLAGCLGKTVKVELNGQRVPVKSFQEYVDLYLKSTSTLPTEPPKRYRVKPNERWEIVVTLSEGQFQQVSFVNGIATIKGGTHVDYITNQITNYVMNAVNKKNKNANVKAHNVKTYLWVFVNALIDNPAFDSQTKETLTIRQSSFGSGCELTPEFLKNVATKSGIMDSVLSWVNFKHNKDLKKTDGTKSEKISGIEKLEDANCAGGKNSEKCTLILTEGDSAKALAMAGLGVVGRDFYGVFPLKGTMLNVRESSSEKITNNKEIQNIKKILGLQQGKEYNNAKALRYGHLMIMTDQDHDGSHIKGLLINFIHTFWPSLLRVPSFLVEFITPIVKATHRNKTVLSFYTMPEYESWKENLRGNASGWSIKYYKGLGTSTSKEGREYFEQLEKHRKDFIWQDDHDGEAIELAFSKYKIQERKNWIRQFEPGTHLDQTEKLIKYSDFVNKELILFSIANLQRSVPSIVDGLKPSQRKILFCSFKRNFTKEAKVSQFAGYVSEHSAYHHGEKSLTETIIGMAQDFVGSNNLNLLMPNGQFGTRNHGGEDKASSRYIYTKLSNITRFLFPKDDDKLLNYLNEDGQSIEPTWYIPIIPMVLVNGSKGIGTGWSSYIPNYNPRDIIRNVRRLLDGETMLPMDPWYRGFLGTIENAATKEGRASYTVSGISEKVNDTMLKIIELPVRQWTHDYKEFLDSVTRGASKNEKDKEKAAKDFCIEQADHHSDDKIVSIDVHLTEENMIRAIQEGLKETLKLTTTLSMNNMHLFDTNGVLKKYNTPEQILEEFFPLRLEFYEKRKRNLLENLEMELLKLENKVRFILAVVNGEIIVGNRRKVDLFHELHAKGFTPFPKKTKSVEPEVAGASNEIDETEESPEVKGERVSDYEYLLALAIGSLTTEKVQELCNERDKLKGEVEDLRKATPKSLWLKDLDSLEKELDEMDRNDAHAEEVRRQQIIKANNKVKPKVSRNAPKAPRNSKKTTNSETVTANMDTSIFTTTEVARNAAVVKPKGKAAPRKAPVKKPQGKAVVVNDDGEDNDEVLELKDDAAYKFDLSPDRRDVSTMEIEASVKKKEPNKRAIAKKKSFAMSDLTSDDEDDSDDEDFDITSSKSAVVKSKGKASPRKASVKKGKAVVVNDDGEDDDEVLELKDDPAANKFDLSPDRPDVSTMETEVPIKKKEPNKRATAKKKSIAKSYQTSDDEDDSDDEDFDFASSKSVVVTPKGKTTPRKTSVKKPQSKAVVVNDDGEDDDEVLELKDDRAADKFDLSPDRPNVSTMGTEVPVKKKEPNKRATVKKKSIAKSYQTSDDEDDNDDEDFDFASSKSVVVTPKGKTTPRKVSVKKPQGKAVVVNDDGEDDDEVLELKDDPVAYKFDLSPDRPDVSTMETEVPVKKKEPNKREIAKKKSIAKSDQTSDDEDDREDEDFDFASSKSVVVTPKGKTTPRKASVKKPQGKAVVVNDDGEDDDEVLELKDDPAAYKFDLSPDRPDVSTMETEVLVKKKEPNKRATAKKKSIAKSNQTSDDEDDSDDEDFDFASSKSVVVTPKGKTTPRKASVKKPHGKAVVVNDDGEDDDEVVELKDHLAAFNFDLPPDGPDVSTMETDVPVKKKEPNKRAAAKKRSIPKSDQISIDEDISDDKDFEIKELVSSVAKMGGGRKAAANAKTTNSPAAANKRESPATLGQKLITQLLAPIENPFNNKKRRLNSGESETSGE